MGLRMIEVDQTELTQIILWLALLNDDDKNSWAFAGGVAATLGWLLQGAESPRAVAAHQNAEAKDPTP